MPILYGGLSKSEVDAYSLVLASMGIPHGVRRGEDGWRILIDPAQEPKARQAIEDYIAENPEPSPAETPPPAYPATTTGLWTAIFLGACYAAMVNGKGVSHFAHHYGADARRILNGAPYLAVTALTIHADAAHLAGNMAGMVLFGSAVCRIAGWGYGWFWILLTGIFGNLINARFYETAHLSVGASTAVFGAVGIVSGASFLRAYRGPGVGARTFLPILAGMALLGFLGTAGENTDLTAHLFGFVAGIPVGGFLEYRDLTPETENPFRQAAFAGIAFFVVVLSWVAAFQYE